MALKYWKLDLAHLKSAEASPRSYNFAEFGVDYAHFLYSFNRSVMDASAQYVILKANLGLLQWDLFRDSNKTAYAVEIKKINDALAMFPNGLKGTDQVFIGHVRRLKRVYLSIPIVAQRTKEHQKQEQAERAAEETRAREARACVNQPLDVYQETYAIIADFANGQSGFGMSAYDTRVFTENWLKEFPCNEAMRYIKVVTVAKIFANNENTLNYGLEEARYFAKTNFNSFCMDKSVIELFIKHKEFANADDGLNLTKDDSRGYAWGKSHSAVLGCDNKF